MYQLQNIPPVTWVDTPEAMMKYVKHVQDTKEASLDTETTGLSRWKDHVLVWSSSPDENTRYCFSREMLPIYSQELARDKSLRWYFTNATFDMCMLKNSGAEVPAGDVFCTLAMDWMYDENRQGRHGLKETALDHCGLSMQEYKEVFGKRPKGEDLQAHFMRAMEENFEAATGYASYDAYATFRVYKWLRRNLRRQYNKAGASLWDYFKQIEMPFTRVLYNMCQRGVRVDVDYLQELSPKMTHEARKIERKITKMAGREINLNSPLQLRWLLFDKLGLKPLKMTKGGESGKKAPSTDKETLDTYAQQGVEVCQLMVELRKLVKIQGTYVDGLQKWIDPNGRIHPVLTQHVAVTGRLSSVDPNLQNIPRPDGDMFGLRQAFIPREGYKLVVFDYEQIEMRLLAHMANETNMIDVINKGWDIHTGTASLMFGHDYEDIIAAVARKKKKLDLSDEEKEMVFARQASKTIGFGLLYGEGVKKLAHTLGVDVDRAKVLLEMFFEPYPAIRDFINDSHRQAHVDHYVETIDGRPRRFPDMATFGHYKWHDLPPNVRGNIAMIERQAVNSRIQGSAASVAKRAMIKCEFSRRLKDLGAELLLQVHDELLFEVPEENADRAYRIIKKKMEHPLPYDLSIPLECDGGIGDTWAAAKA